MQRELEGHKAALRERSKVRGGSGRGGGGRLAKTNMWSSTCVTSGMTGMQ